MTTGHRSNIYLQADAIRNLELLFLRLQACGDIPANEKVDNLGKYRSQLITFALEECVQHYQSMKNSPILVELKETT